MILNYNKTSVSAYLESIWGYESRLATGEQLPNVLLGMGMYLIHAIIFTKETYKAVSLKKKICFLFFHLFLIVVHLFKRFLLFSQVLLKSDAIFLCRCHDIYYSLQQSMFLCPLWHLKD